MKSRRRSRVTRLRSQFLQRSQRSMSNIRNISKAGYFLEKKCLEQGGK